MKAILFLAALMPLGVLAQPININNNPNQPGYQQSGVPGSGY